MHAIFQTTLRPAVLFLGWLKTSVRSLSVNDSTVPRDHKETIKNAYFQLAQQFRIRNDKIKNKFPNDVKALKSSELVYLRVNRCVVTELKKPYEDSNNENVKLYIKYFIYNIYFNENAIWKPRTPRFCNHFSIIPIRLANKVQVNHPVIHLLWTLSRQINSKAASFRQVPGLSKQPSHSTHW